MDVNRNATGLCDFLQRRIRFFILNIHDRPVRCVPHIGRHTPPATHLLSQRAPAIVDIVLLTRCWTVTNGLKPNSGTPHTGQPAAIYASGAECVDAGFGVGEVHYEEYGL